MSKQVLVSCESPSEAPEVYPTYPDWVVKHLTPGLEAKSSSGVKNPGLGWHEKQEKRETITGDEIFAFLLPDQEMYQAQWYDPINHCISLADIQYYEEKYPHRIPLPLEWEGNWVYAWKSVVLDGRGRRVVPFLCCRGGRPFVVWYNLGSYWCDYEPAGLSAS